MINLEPPPPPPHTLPTPSYELILRFLRNPHLRKRCFKADMTATIGLRIEVE